MKVVDLDLTDEKLNEYLSFRGTFGTKKLNALVDVFKKMMDDIEAKESIDIYIDKKYWGTYRKRSRVLCYSKTSKTNTRAYLIPEGNKDFIDGMYDADRDKMYEVFGHDYFKAGAAVPIVLRTIAFNESTKDEKPKKERIKR